MKKRLIALFLLLAIYGFADEILFFDNFDKADKAAWEIYDAGTVSQPSNWITEEGVYVQKSNIYSSDKPAWSGTYAVAGDSAWTDYVFEAKIRSTDDDGTGVIFRYTDNDNYYRLRLIGTDRSWDGKVLDKKVNGKWTVLANESASYADKAWHQLKIMLTKNRIIVFYDNAEKPIIDYTDAVLPLLNGKIGLYTWGNQSTYFDDIKVLHTPLSVSVQIARRILLTGKKYPLTINITNYSKAPVELKLNNTGTLKLGGMEDKIQLKKEETKDYRLELTSAGTGSIAFNFTYNGALVFESKTILFTSRELFRYIPLKGDFHMHTTYSDGSNTPVEMVIQAKKSGLDVIAVTDHETTNGSLAAGEFINKNKVRMLSINAEENPCDFPNTHILAYNIPDNITHIAGDCPPDLKTHVELIIDWAKSKGVVFFQAHPTWDGHSGTDDTKLKFTQYLLDKKLITGYEIINESIAQPYNANTLLYYKNQVKAGIYFPVLGNSDAHSTGGLGYVYNLVFAEKYNQAAILKSIAEGRVVVVDSQTNTVFGSPALCELAKIYIEDFFPVHDQYALQEGSLIRLIQGGHSEKQAELNALYKKWDELYAVWW